MPAYIIHKDGVAIAPAAECKTAQTMWLVQTVKEIVAMVDRYIAMPIHPGQKQPMHYLGFAVPWEYINALRAGLTPEETRELPETRPYLPSPGEHCRHQITPRNGWCLQCVASYLDAIRPKAINDR